MKNKIVIKSDNLCICDRLKEVDPTYYIIFNLARKKFEVHSSCQRGGSYCFTIPYDALDERTIFYARKSRIERKDEVIREMDKENERREKRLYQDAVDRLKEVL